MSEAEKASATSLVPAQLPTPSSPAISTAPRAPNLVLDWNDGTTARITWTKVLQKQSIPLPVTASTSDEYKITVRDSDGGMTTETTNCREHFITKMIPGLAYFVSVMQVNKAESSEPSNMITFNAAPKSPTNICVKNYEPSPSDSLVVSFDDENKRKMRYKVVVQPLTQSDEVKIPGDEYTNRCYHLITGLIPGEIYNVHIIAADDGGLESEEASYHEMVKTFPAQPNGTKLEYSIEMFNFSWKPLDIKPAFYRVFCQANNEVTTYETKDTFFKLSKLEPATNYMFRVAGVNSAGCGEKSEEESHFTDPSPPRNILVTPNPLARQSSLIVKYEGMTRPNTEYKVEEALDAAGETLVDGLCATINDLSPG